jgi:hypothetical protein
VKVARLSRAKGAEMMSPAPQLPLEDGKSLTGYHIIIHRSCDAVRKEHLAVCNPSHRFLERKSSSLVGLNRDEGKGCFRGQGFSVRADFSAAVLRT